MQKDEELERERIRTIRNKIKENGRQSLTDEERVILNKSALEAVLRVGGVINE